MNDDELSPSQAAARLGASTRSVQRWIREGRLPARRVGGRWRVSGDVIDAFGAFDAGEAEAGSAAPPQAPASAQRSPIRVLYVANRGEVASRIRRTCLRLGIRAIRPGLDGEPAVDLLDGPAVVAAALTVGADTVHPGFGFLSESADFAEAVIAAGLRWVGPPPEAIRAMGDKAAARRLAARLGVPVIPGYDDEDQTDAALVAAAARIGTPLIVKPAAGGGGKGMRVVRDLATLPASLEAARREARGAFGDERLILERLLEGPRHVEIQVMFDAHGHGVHLGERDCSIQRRHQKILEESPSPAVDDDLRGRLGRAALDLAAAVGYAGAGTCEFLLDDHGEASFLEMNTRLQVEHPVTEMVTGRDLVEDQLRIAVGATLGVTQSDLDRARATGGHAIEVRLYAEDPEAGFLPATGTVELLHWPAGAGIRVDAGIEPGSVVGGRFDPMLAKIVAHGPDRATALERLCRALDETVVLGLTTNLRFLRWLIRQPAVVDGEARIDSLEAIWPPSVPFDDIPTGAWRTAAASLAADHGIGWRLNAPARLRIADERGAERSVTLDEPPGGRGPAVVRDAAGVVHVDVDGRSVAFRLAPPPDVERSIRAAAGHHAGGSQVVEAPMPGAVLAIHVAPDAVVAPGDPLVTLEAMKMEHVVTAPGPGRVAAVEVRPGGQVRRGQVLVVLE